MAPVKEIFLAEWLGEEAHGPGFQRPVANAVIGIGRDEDDRNLAASDGEVFLQSRTIHARHLDVEHQTRRSFGAV